MVCDVDVPSRRESISPLAIGFGEVLGNACLGCISFYSLKVDPEDILESRLLEATFGPSPFQPSSGVFFVDLRSQRVAAVESV
jgi:hypothetical protein